VRIPNLRVAVLEPGRKRLRPAGQKADIGTDRDEERAEPEPVNVTDTRADAFDARCRFLENAWRGEAAR